MAYAEGHLTSSVADDTTVEDLFQNIAVKFDSQFITSQQQALKSRGFTHAKHFKGLKKKTFYDLGIATLIAQELRKEVKRCFEGKSKAEYELPSEALSNMTLSEFKLPIVGSIQAKALMSASTLSGDSGTLTMTSGVSLEMSSADRVIRQVDGKTYEYDRRCPHKGVDLATVLNIFLTFPNVIHV
jgi:hypothetical protein